jgi:hypothetical protein
MAKELTQDEDVPTIGTCTGCGQWGHAFSYCGNCGEDSGQIFFPDPNTDYTKERESSDEASSEDGYLKYNKTQTPMYSRDWHPNYMSGFFDPFRSLPIEELFTMMYQHIHGGNEEHTINEYMLDRCTTMRLFGYNLVPTIIQNYDNIKYNIQLHTENYLPRVRPSKHPDFLHHFTQEELTLVIKWGVHILQLHTQHILQQKNYEPQVFSTVENVDNDNDNGNVKEHCFSMKDFRWNIHQKKFYRINNNIIIINTKILTIIIKIIVMSLLILKVILIHMLIRIMTILNITLQLIKHITCTNQKIIYG